MPSPPPIPQGCAPGSKSEAGSHERVIYLRGKELSALYPRFQREDMSKPVAKDLDEEEALREVIDALRADNGRLLRLLIAAS